jgi:type III secretion protein W
MMRTQSKGDDFRGSDLLKEVLDLQQNKWVRPEQIAALPGKLGIRRLTHEINFLREFKALVHSIPLKAYADPEQRPRFLDAIQQALDEAIEREEENQ